MPAAQEEVVTGPKGHADDLGKNSADNGLNLGVRGRGVGLVIHRGFRAIRAGGFDQPWYVELAVIGKRQGRQGDDSVRHFRRWQQLA